MKLNELTINKAKEGLLKKEFSSTELTVACLEQIKTHDEKLNSFITLCEEKAIEDAKKADAILNSETTCLAARRAEQLNNRPLLGIPIALKDLYLTKGIKTTAGSKVLGDYIPEYDATVVEKLKNAGAIIIGKTNCDAWAHGSSGENSDFGPTKNPWDLNFVPGGSSSGSAVSVSTDMCLAASGTDTGGSVRQPASFCNVVGLKPTYGRVSRYGIVAMASSLDSIGHFTKTVEDCAIYLNVTAGKDKHDATTPEIEVPDYTKNLNKGVKGIKIGIPKEYFSDGVDPKIIGIIKEALKKLEMLGAEIVDIS
ncbi:MAG: amidase, partial [bacterium]|nr:amidase [bacterium]